MTDPSPLFQSPVALAAAAAIVAITVVIAWRRRVALSQTTQGLALTGMLLLALAAGGPTWPRPAAREVAVMIDVSPSTRGAAYRDRAALARRVAELLGGTPHRLYTFADGLPTADLQAADASAGGPLADVAVDGTTYVPPPAAAAVLLFSDGRFPLPADAPPTFAVVDPNLLAAADARVTSIRVDGTGVAAQIDSTAGPRSLTWSGTEPAADVRLSAEPILAGSYVLRRPLPSDTKANPAATLATPPSPIIARLSPGDAWPENDALTLRPVDPERRERWLVAAPSPAPGAEAQAGFRMLMPADLPTDPAAYLAASAIVLDNVPADALSAAVRDRLAHYVRDLGGGLAIAGGDRSFAAGGYVGTPLDALSPLASVPPRPTAHWMLLTDGSGSMAAPAAAGVGGANAGSRWQAASAALVRLLPALPPDDVVDVGSFAETLTWWTVGGSARAARDLPLPPPQVSPHGPTNLRPAIESAVSRIALAVSSTPGGDSTPPAPPPPPGHLLLLSDADADVGDVPSLVAMLKARNVKLHLLAVDAGRGLADLQAVSRLTGGQAVRQDDAARWADAAGELLRAAGETYVRPEPLVVMFAGQLATLPGRTVSPWNQTWIKPRATAFATAVRMSPAATSPAEASAGPLAMAAVWEVGEGRVATAAFATTPAERAALADAVARSPRDPQVTVTWDVGRSVRVRVDVDDADSAAAWTYGNGLAFTLDLSAADGSGLRTQRLEQVGPGQYEGEFPAIGTPGIATLRQAGRAVTREAVAGRYPPEFDTVGVDREALSRLADRTGGRVIEPTDHRPIEFRWPRRDVPLAPWLAAAGAAMFLAALSWWKFR